MSHVVTIDTVFNDLEALDRACKKLGWTLKRGQKCYKWYGRWVNDYHGDNAAYKKGFDTNDYGKCDHAIGIPGCRYEIGLVDQGDGTLKPIYDNYSAGGLTDQMLDQLSQRYSAERIRLEAERQGLSCSWEEWQSTDGKLVLKMTEY